MAGADGGKRPKTSFTDLKAIVGRLGHLISSTRGVASHMALRRICDQGKWTIGTNVMMGWKHRREHGAGRAGGFLRRIGHDGTAPVRHVLEANLHGDRSLAVLCLVLW